MEEYKLADVFLTVSDTENFQISERMAAMRAGLSSQVGMQKVNVSLGVFYME